MKDPRIGKLTPEQATSLKRFAEEIGMTDHMPAWMAREIEEKTRSMNLDTLHAQIMNLPATTHKGRHEYNNGFKDGHKEARRAAAELVLRANIPAGLTIPLKKNNVPTKAGVYAFKAPKWAHLQMLPVQEINGVLTVALFGGFELMQMNSGVLWSDALTFTTEGEE